MYIHICICSTNNAHDVSAKFSTPSRSMVHQSFIARAARPATQSATAVAANNKLVFNTLLTYLSNAAADYETSNLQLGKFT